MELNFLYWNLYNKGSKLAPILKELVVFYKIDILVVSEISLRKEFINEHIEEIKTATNMEYFKATKKDNNDTWLFIFYKKTLDKFSLKISYPKELVLSERDLVDKSQSEDLNYSKYIERNERMFFIQLSVQNLTFLLVPLHFPSRMYAGSDKQLAIAQVFRRHIELFEKNVKHSNTIIFGDFNMMPFEKGMISHTGFHALAAKNITIPHTHTGEEHHSFYNPTWAHLGDYDFLQTTEKPAGTYYNNNSSDLYYYWYWFDQVILRKEVIPFFDLAQYQVIHKFNSISLLTSKGIIDNINFSDHLPIKFSLKI